MRHDHDACALEGSGNRKKKRTHVQDKQKEPNRNPTKWHATREEKENKTKKTKVKPKKQLSQRGTETKRLHYTGTSKQMQTRVKHKTPQTPKKRTSEKIEKPTKNQKLYKKTQKGEARWCRNASHSIPTRTVAHLRVIRDRVEQKR